MSGFSIFLVYCSNFQFISCDLVEFTYMADIVFLMDFFFKTNFDVLRKSSGGKGGGAGGGRLGVNFSLEIDV